MNYVMKEDVMTWFGTFINEEPIEYNDNIFFAYKMISFYKSYNPIKFLTRILS